MRRVQQGLRRNAAPVEAHATQARVALDQRVAHLRAGTDPKTLAHLGRWNSTTTLLETYSQGLADKLGLRGEQAGDRDLTVDFLDLLARNGADYTRSFRALGSIRSNEEMSRLCDDFLDREAFDAWYRRYRERLLQEGSDDSERQARMNAVNPKYILRNYLAQQAIEKAQAGDFSEIETLQRLLTRPFDE